MSQSNIIELLEKESEPLSMGEIADMLKANYSKVVKDINKMIKYKEIKYLEIDRLEAMKKYHCRRRMRLYFIDGEC